LGIPSLLFSSDTDIMAQGKRQNSENLGLLHRRKNARDGAKFEDELLFIANIGGRMTNAGLFPVPR
jgi:hypothetical protein